jgi:hypothetical protein
MEKEPPVRFAWLNIESGKKRTIIIDRSRQRSFFSRCSWRGMMRLKIFYSFSGKCNAYVKYCGV